MLFYAFLKKCGVSEHNSYIVLEKGNEGCKNETVKI